MLMKVGAVDIVEKVFEKLKEIGRIIAPIREGGHTRLKPVESFIDVDTSSLRTLLPPKKYLFPPRDELITLSGDCYKEHVPLDFSPFVLFGIHPCDIHGIEILTSFMEREFPDPYYLERRRRTFIVGTSCLPDDKCFCRSMGCSHAEKGFDIFMTILEDRIMLRSGTAVGLRLMRRLNGDLRKPNREDRQKYLEFMKRRNAAFSLSLEIDELPEILDLEEESEIWESLGNRCFTCGNCSMVCPTCSCFQVYDVVSFDDGSITRVRQWDSCLFRSYTLVAGGHTFREKRSQRVKNRYLHKQKGFVEAFGKPSCVGCGRCISSCPAGIDMVKVFSSLTEVYGR